MNNMSNVQVVADLDAEEMARRYAQMLGLQVDPPILATQARLGFFARLLRRLIGKR